MDPNAVLTRFEPFLFEFELLVKDGIHAHHSNHDVGHLYLLAIDVLEGDELHHVYYVLLREVYLIHEVHIHIVLISQFFEV
jgi:hypothetical protein